MSAPRSIRRIITGHREDGKSIHVVDDRVDLSSPAGVVIKPIYEADHPADNSAKFVDRLSSISGHLVNPSGTKLLITESPPAGPDAPLKWHRTDSCAGPSHVAR